jgi:glycine cleavage system protein P-like pyridoxal-binding family
MKKFIISAVMALLIGGFAFTANAQEKVTKKATETKIEKKDPKKVDSQVDKNAVEIAKYDNLLAQYEAAVKECLAIYKGESTNKTSLDDQVKKALKIKDQIEKVKENLTPTQAEKFKSINKDLDKVLKK